MSEMTALEPILTRFLDNRESLTDGEFTQLLEALRTHPPLAERLKDHLLMDELLAQQYIMDRKDFVGKFAQRLHEENKRQLLQAAGPAFGKAAETYSLRWPEHAEPNGNATRTAGNGHSVQKQALETSEARTPAKSAASKLQDPPPANGPGHPWLKFWAVMGGLFLIAAGLLRLEYTEAARGIAEVNEVTGMALIYRSEVGTVAAPGMRILPGDEIRVQEDAELKLSFRDRSQLRIGSNSTITLHPGTGRLPGLLTSELAKSVFVNEGTLEADIIPQQTGKPMTLQTTQLEAEVLGTRFLVTASAEQSRLEVIEGLIQVRSKHHEDPPVEVSSGYQVAASQAGILHSVGAWPTNEEGLVFLLSPRAEVSRTPDEGVRVFADGENHSPSILRPRRDAALEQGRMVFHGGAFLAEDQTASALMAACQATNSLSIEVTFQTSELSQTGPARWISLSSNSEAWNFSLVQEGRQAVLRLLTSQESPGEQRREIPLFEIPDDQPHHVMVTYGDDQLKCYLDGKEIPVTAEVRGTFAAWKPHHLLFGDEWNGGGAWAGTLAGVAIYNRVLSADEVARNALHYTLQFEK